MRFNERPVLGLCAFSGTGKTTLLTGLLPLLRARGLRVGVVKHAHHAFDMDQPGKDSHTLRESGASQIVVASSQRIASIEEQPTRGREPHLADALARINPADIDLVIAEGFKAECFPKIELHRPSMGKPLLCRQDNNIIAVASDEALDLPDGVLALDLNAQQDIADFVISWPGLERTAEATA